LRDEKISAGDAVELAECFQNYASWLFGHACVITRGDKGLADELVQDTFVAAARAWETLRGFGGNQQRGWLLSVLSNMAVSSFRRAEAFRRKQAAVYALYQGVEADTSAAALDAIALRRFQEVVESLPARQHVIARMRWQEGMKVNEIAAELGIAEGTVSAHLHTVRRKLVTELGPYYPFSRDDAEGGAS
jgi:RNA polymerase sigma factor (sigma-70 family)